MGINWRGYEPLRRALLHNRVEAVGLDALAHVFGGALVSEGADLDVEELVLGFVADEYGVAVFFERGDFDVGNLLAGDRGDLDHVGPGTDGSGGCGCGWGGR